MGTTQRGGARNRSGPQPDPSSARSDQRGLTLTALPAQGYDGGFPEFPLPTPLDREVTLWGQLWRTPQAAAWATAPWRHYTVAQYVRWSVKAESPEAPAAIVAAVIRFADQIGLTPAGLKENGWAIAPDEVGAARQREGGPRQRRLRAAPGVA